MHTSAFGEGPAIVKWCLDPAEIADLPFEEFNRMVSSRNGGDKQVQRLEEIYRKAGISIGCVAHPSAAFEAETLLDGLKQFHIRILATDRKIAEVCKRFPEYPCLLSIPGFGPDISAKVIGAVGNPYRFDNHRQVLKTAGLDLSADRSGKRTEVAPVISKKGKADLRYGLYQAALVASTRSHRFMTYFGNTIKGREKEKGILTNRRVKLAAKMLTIAWTLMKKKEMFNPGCMEYIIDYERRESPIKSVEAHDLVWDNRRASHQNHATWTKDDGRLYACRILITMRCGFAFV
jgi:transposase